MADIIETIDLHMHSTVSDGTDTPEEILAKIRDTGLSVFSITDHDAIKSATMIPPLLHAGDPRFITGVEFSCKDINGKYHILGYGYDPAAEPIRAIVEKGHGFRMEKTRGRLDFLRDHFGFKFPDAEIDELLHLDNPGKPHIANLMVKYHYAENRKQAIEEFIDKKHFQNIYLQPEEAIHAIALSGGIPVLAHPSYGSGDELIIGVEMDERLRRLVMEGLKGVEAYYSGFTPKLQQEMLGFAEKYDLYVTAGSDYHGKNKLISIGDNNLDTVNAGAEGVRRFLRDVQYACVPA